MVLALFKLAETMVGCLNSGENIIVIVSRIFVSLCFKTMLQKRVIHSTSATKHYRNPTLPKIQIPLPCPRLFTHIFTCLALHCILLSFLTFTCSLKNLSQQSCVWSRSVRRPKTLGIVCMHANLADFSKRQGTKPECLRYCSKLYENSEVLKIWQQ